MWVSRGCSDTSRARLDWLKAWPALVATETKFPLAIVFVHSAFFWRVFLAFSLWLDGSQITGPTQARVGRQQLAHYTGWIQCGDETGWRGMDWTVWAKRPADPSDSTRSRNTSASSATSNSPGCLWDDVLAQSGSEEHDKPQHSAGLRRQERCHVFCPCAAHRICWAISGFPYRICFLINCFD